MGSILVLLTAICRVGSDGLTDALTRHAFHAMPHGMKGVVIMIDVDNLKQINDISGHAAGDAAIRAVANAVRNRIRAEYRSNS